MIYGSVASGIEAATVAYHPLGWRPAWFSEIEPFPCRLLKYHYPQTPNLGDMLNLTENKIFNESTIDILVGGTPCQSFSIAGLRAGLDSANGNLSLQFIRLLERKRCRWFKWENVPGVFSSSGGSDFAAMLSGWTGRDIKKQKFSKAGIIQGKPSHWSIAWRVFDSQYFGVPQRRRRVFVVGYIGDNWRAPAAVLFESESLFRDFTPGKETGKGIAGTLNARTRGGGFPGTDESLSGYVQPYNVSFNDVNGKRKDRPDGGLYVNETEVSNVVNTAGVGETLLVGSFWDGSQTTQTLDAVLHKGQMMPDKNRFPVVLQPKGVQWASGGGKTENDTMQALRSNAETNYQFLRINNSVRRLTPLECERLQGFPDNYTNIPGASDSARYKALGNSMTTNVMAYIGDRIDKVDKTIKGEL